VIYPPGATIQLLELGRRSGATVREGVDVREIVPNGVRCGNETLHADIVVNAAGAAAPRTHAGLPILPRKGHLAITDRYPRPVSASDRRARISHERARDDERVRRVQRAAAFDGTGVDRLVAGARRLGRIAQSRDPRKNARARSAAHAGVADVSIIRTLDWFSAGDARQAPVIGRWDPCRACGSLEGHEGLGITMSLATAEIIADQIAARAPQVDAAPFSPMRVLSQPVAGATA
jgi:glycine/D-amino acid oxidase-like deaminating enzyme